jgi:hypothetical protein
VRLEAMRLGFETESYNLGAVANGVQNPTKSFDHDTARHGICVMRASNHSFDRRSK